MTLEKGSPVQMLTAKLALWLARQEEWETILALPRNQRRAAERELATRMYAIPSAEHPPEHLSRKQKRQLDKAADREAVSRVAEQKLAAATALNDALAQSLAEEALASVRLDGETQTLAADPMPEVFMDEVLPPGGYMEAEVTPATFGEPVTEWPEELVAAEEAEVDYAVVDEMPDPEGDVKADLEAANAAIETEVAEPESIVSNETQEEVEDEEADTALD